MWWGTMWMFNERVLSWSPGSTPISNPRGGQYSRQKYIRFHRWELVPSMFVHRIHPTIGSADPWPLCCQHFYVLEWEFTLESRRKYDTSYKALVSRVRKSQSRTPEQSRQQLWRNGWHFDTSKKINSTIILQQNARISRMYCSARESTWTRIQEMRIFGV